MPTETLNDIQFKARSGAQVTVDKAEGIVECFVAGIGNKDSVGDIVLPGAFTESLKRRKPRVVWGHSWNEPIGKVLEIYEVPNSDPRLPQKMKSAGIGGLFAKVQFNLGAEKGREAFANVAFFGEEQEWSIGYKTLQATFDPIQQANMLKEVELYEVSPVLHGANQLTGTISVKDGETGACGTNGCECSVKSTTIEPEAPEGIVFEKGFMMGRMPMLMIPLPMPKPEGNPTDTSGRDIWSRGEAGPIGSEDRLKLATEIHGRTKVPIKIVEATENMVVFLRKMVDGTDRMYRMPYHKTDSGQYMFGKPARVKPQTVYTPDNTPGPPNPLGHMHRKPNSGPILGKDPNSEEIKDGAPILIPCAVESILETKDALSPIFEYYEATVTPSSGGLIITDYKPEFREAADTALKALGGKLGRGGGLGKGRRAGRALTARFDPKAWDGDHDGLVQEGTPFERPSIPGINTNLPGQRPTRQKPKESPDDHRSSRQQGGMRSGWGQNAKPGAVPRPPPEPEAKPEPVVDQAKVSSLNSQIDKLRTGKLDPLLKKLRKAEEDGNEKEARRIRAEMAPLQDEEGRMREQLGEAMGKGRALAGMRSLVKRRDPEKAQEMRDLHAQLTASHPMYLGEDMDSAVLDAIDIFDGRLPQYENDAAYLRQTATDFRERRGDNEDIERGRDPFAEISDEDLNAAADLLDQAADAIEKHPIDIDEIFEGMTGERGMPDATERMHEALAARERGGLPFSSQRDERQRGIGEYFKGIATEDLEREIDFIRSLNTHPNNRVAEDVTAMQEIYGDYRRMYRRHDRVMEELELRDMDDLFRDQGTRNEEIRDMSIRQLRNSDIHPDAYQSLENTFSSFPDDDPIWDMSLREIAKEDGGMYFGDNDIEDIIRTDARYRSSAPGTPKPRGRGRHGFHEGPPGYDPDEGREDRVDPDGPDAGRGGGGGMRSRRGNDDDLADDEDYSDWLARNHGMTDETLDEMAREYDEPPNSGMRSMTSGDRRKRIGELNEKLQVLDESIARAGRFENPDYKRMVDTENRLAAEISGLRRSETLFNLESGSRSRIAAKKTLELNLTEDEIGSLRNHIQEMVKGNPDKKVNGALASYDTLLANAKNGKIKVPAKVYDNIVDHWDKATGGKKIHPKTGRDILEFAAMSDDSKFTSTSVGQGDDRYSGFGTQRVNNGAPAEITPRMQKEMLGGMRYQRDTGQGVDDTGARLRDVSQLDMNEVLDADEETWTPGVQGGGLFPLRQPGGHSLMFNAMEADGHGSPRQWQIVRGHHGMRSMLYRQGDKEIAPSALPGEKPVGGRQVGTEMPNPKLQGKKFNEVKPANWDQMDEEAQWDFVSSLLPWTKDRPDGIRRADLDKLILELAKKIDVKERRQNRREGKFETLQERRARRAEQGVKLPTREPAKAPAEPKPQTPQGAAQERRETLTALDNLFARIHTQAQDASTAGELEDEHLDLWGKAMDILSDSDDLTYSQIEALDALFDEYLSKDFENLSAAESASRRSALGQKQNIETLLAKYRGDRDIQQGDTDAAQHLGGGDDIVDPTEAGDAVATGGMRSMVSRNRQLFPATSPVRNYVQAPRPKPNSGMRATREGRTQISGEATWFKKIEDSLSREISEARKDDNRTTVKALELLKQILSRQESGKTGDKRTNAGLLTVTQAEIDQILEGLMNVVDRQVAADGSRAQIFIDLMEKLSEAAMSTFILKTSDEIHSRTQKRTNSRGDQVTIPLNS
jgi:HK97 family phage prohead protease